MGVRLFDTMKILSKRKLARRIGYIAFCGIAVFFWNVRTVESEPTKMNFKHSMNLVYAMPNPITEKSLMPTSMSESKIVKPVIQKPLIPETNAPKKLVYIPPAKVNEKAGSYTFIATAYSCGGVMTASERANNCPNGRTASGTIPKAGRTLACPKHMLGKTIELVGYGKRVCEDVGGDIVNGRIDVYMETIQDARVFGRKTVSIPR